MACFSYSSLCSLLLPVIASYIVIDWVDLFSQKIGLFVINITNHNNFGSNQGEISDTLELISEGWQAGVFGIDWMIHMSHQHVLPGCTLLPKQVDRPRIDQRVNTGVVC